MKADVIKAYTDRHTRGIHLVGDVVDLTDERLAELAAGGYVKASDERPKRRATRRPAAKKQG